MDLSHKEKEKKSAGNYTNSSRKKKNYKKEKNFSNEDIKSNEVNEKKESNDIKENNDINVDYEKNVTISEACRGLSDVILDFRVYLMKYFLKKKKINK